MFLMNRGTRLFVERLGTGPDVILLHPTPVDHRFWMPVALELKDRFRLTLPDLRGHGKSDSSDTISISRLAEDVLAVLDELVIERAIFAGCSIGCYVLYELWRNAPNRIKALAFCCGKPQPDSDTNRAKRLETIENVSRNGTAEFFDEMLATLVSPSYRQHEPQGVAELRNMMSSMSADAVIAVQRALMARPDSVPTIKTISVPVLALAADGDRASTPAEMAVIPELLPASEFHPLQNTGHFAAYEQPQAVAGILRAFFEKASAQEG